VAELASSPLTSIDLLCAPEPRGSPATSKGKTVDAHRMSPCHPSHRRAVRGFQGAPATPPTGADSPE